MAIQMTGVTDRHLYSVSTNFLQSNVPYSISVWINATWNGGSRLSFVGMYDGGLTTPTPTTGLQIGTGAGAGEVSCWTYGGTILVQSATAVMTPFNGTWVLVTYTFDGTNHRVYRDNTLLATSSAVPPVPGTFTQVYINGYPPTGTSSETGTFQVDSYSYYGRQLSTEEIGTIYYSRGTRHGIVDGLIARYDFDELSQGTTVTGVIDISGNGNTLLNTGAGTAITYTYTNTIANANLRPVQ
jgi:hypothetical protein